MKKYELLVIQVAMGTVSHEARRARKLATPIESENVRSSNEPAASIGTRDSGSLTDSRAALGARFEMALGWFAPCIVRFEQITNKIKIAT
jgi:hypothetical protein